METIEKLKRENIRLVEENRRLNDQLMSQSQDSVRFRNQYLIG